MDGAPMTGGMMGQSKQGMGSGMMQGGMGPGMMQGGMGSGMLQGGMGSGGGAIFGSRVTPMMNLSVDDVRGYLAVQLDRLNNKRLKVGDIKSEDGTITADIVTVELDLVVRSLGASGTLMGTGRASSCAASGTAAPLERPIVLTTLDLTADLAFGCYIKWSSAANGTDSALCNLFTVEIDP
jgi:hypothetical protein